MTVMRLFYCVPCNARDRLHTLESGRWACVVCQNQVDDRGAAPRSAPPDGPVPVSPAAGTGPSPCWMCRRGWTRPHPCRANLGSDPHGDAA